MIAMQGVTGAAVGAALPVAAAAATAAGATAPAGLVSAEQAFDEVFRQLTGGLLTTAAGEGLAAAVDDATDGAVATAAAPDVVAADSAVVTAIVVPVLPALPVMPLTTAPEAGTPDGVLVDGDGRDIATNNPGQAVTAAGTARVATATATAASAAGAAATPTTIADPIDSTTVTGSDVSAAQTPRPPVVVATSPEAAAPGITTAMTPGSTLATAPRAAAADAEVETEITSNAETAPAAVTVSARRADVGRVAADTAAPAATETPATTVGVDERGLDGRRGMRETPARARTFAVASDAASTIAATPAPTAPAATEPQSSVAAPAAPAEGTPEHTAAAERVFALQRALARQTDGEPRPGTSPTAASTITTAAVVAALSGGATGQGAESHTDGETPGRRQGRAWQGAIAAAAAAIVPQTAHLAGETTTVVETPPVLPGPAAGAAWRAALAASAITEMPGAPVEAASGGLRPSLVTAAPAFELPALRERASIVIDAPVAMPELDSATGEAVHTQIVKSLRLQWHGGIGEARVTLKPGYLGEVVASVKVEQGVVTATLQADTPEVRRWMESHTATLRDALVDHGLKLDRLTVAEPERQTAQGDKQSRSRQQHHEAPRQRARRETSESDTPFEVITE